MEVSFDREHLKKALSVLKLPAGEAEWCVACGAGAASQKLEYPEEVIRQVGAQFIQPQALRELVETMREKGGESAWCVACGAGAKSSPLDMLSNPEKVTDEMIDQISQVLIGAVKVG